MTWPQNINNIQCENMYHLTVDLMYQEISSLELFCPSVKAPWILVAYLFDGRQTRLQIKNILLNFIRHFTKALDINILSRLIKKTFNIGRHIIPSTKVNHIYTVKEYSLNVKCNIFFLWLLYISFIYIKAFLKGKPIFSIVQCIPATRRVEEPFVGQL